MRVQIRVLQGDFVEQFPANICDVGRWSAHHFALERPATSPPTVECLDKGVVCCAPAVADALSQHSSVSVALAVSSGAPPLVHKIGSTQFFFFDCSDCWLSSLCKLCTAVNVDVAAIFCFPGAMLCDTTVAPRQRAAVLPYDIVAQASLGVVSAQACVALELLLASGETALGAAGKALQLFPGFAGETWLLLLRRNQDFASVCATMFGTRALSDKQRSAVVFESRVQRVASSTCSVRVTWKCGDYSLRDDVVVVLLVVGLKTGQVQCAESRSIVCRVTGSAQSVIVHCVLAPPESAAENFIDDARAAVVCSPSWCPHVHATSGDMLDDEVLLPYAERLGIATRAARRAVT